MRSILHLAPTGNWAGTEQMVANMCNRLADRCRIGVVLEPGPNAPEDTLRRRFDDRVEVIVVPESSSPGEQAEYVAGRLTDHPDIVHTHLRPGVELARRLQLDATTVAHLHVRFFSAQVWDVDAVICVSPWQARDIPAWFEGPVVVVPNWVEPFELADRSEVATIRSDLGVPPQGLLVGGIGRLSEEKAFSVLCRAFSEAAGADDRLVIIGDGPEMERLSALADCDPRIRLPGYRPDARRFLSALDVFGSSSRLDSFGLSVLEAMSARVPIVATRARGPADILRGSEARLAAIDDVTEFGAALRELLADIRQGRPEPAYDLDPYDPLRAAELLSETYERLAVRG